MHFWSDNSATVAPQIMAALRKANQGSVKSYGADAISERLGEEGLGSVTLSVASASLEIMVETVI